MSKRKKTDPDIRIGKLEPEFSFFLNPHLDYRFTNCPICEQRMTTRKKPFFIHVEPATMIVLNMTARFCPMCELLILHRDKLEQLLVAACIERFPEIIGNDYMVLGTLERSHWRQVIAGSTSQEALEHLHDFRRVLTFEPQYPTWVLDPKLERNRYKSSKGKPSADK
jgi:hypothetical protein